MSEDTKQDALASIVAIICLLCLTTCYVNKNYTETRQLQIEKGCDK